MRTTISTLTPLLRYSLWDPEGRELWQLGDVRPISEPAVAAEGNLCFIGLGDGSGSVSLICVGDRPSS